MRTMLKGMAAAALVAGFAMSAQAETKPGTPAPSATAAPTTETSVIKHRRYCVVGTITGSRIARKECRTRAEWLVDGFDPLDPK